MADCANQYKRYEKKEQNLQCPQKRLQYRQSPVHLQRSPEEETSTRNITWDTPNNFNQLMYQAVFRMSNSGSNLLLLDNLAFKFVKVKSMLRMRLATTSLRIHRVRRFHPRFSQ